MAFKSHIEGKNALVVIYPDRIEWTRTRMLGRAASDMVLMRSVSGVITHKAGLGYTSVRIEAGSSSVIMRVTKAQAVELRRVVLEHSTKSG